MVARLRRAGGGGGCGSSTQLAELALGQQVVQPVGQVEDGEDEGENEAGDDVDALRPRRELGQQALAGAAAEEGAERAPDEPVGRGHSAGGPWLGAEDPAAEGKAVHVDLTGVHRRRRRRVAPRRGIGR